MMAGAGWVGACRERAAIRPTPALADFTQCLNWNPTCRRAGPRAARSWARSGAGTKRPRRLIAGRRWAAITRSIPWYFHAALRLYAGDQPGYRRACQTMLERFANDQRSVSPSLVAHAATLGARLRRRPGRVVKLAEQAARTNPRDSWVVYTVGAALRRAGRLDEAVTRLDQAAHVNPDWPGTPLIAAMRELCERARLLRAGQDPQKARAIVNKTSITYQSEKASRRDPENQCRLAVSARGLAALPRARCDDMKRKARR